MRRAFTLIEILLSLILGSLIFFYSYNVINTTKKSHGNYKAKSISVVDSSNSFSLLYKDIQNSNGNFSLSSGKKFDRISFYTNNSLYGMSVPYVQYFVSKKNNSLVRVEHPEFFDVFSIGDSLNQNLPFMFADVIMKECKSFRVSLQNDSVNVMVRNDNSNIVFKVFKGLR